MVGGPRSAGVLLTEEGQQHDLEIEQEVPIFDVVEVAADARVEIGVAAVAVDLGPAGDARLDVVARVVVGDLLLEVADEFGALGARADEAHVALQDVPELRRLIDVPLAHKRADGETPRIVGPGPAGASVALGVEAHAADLVAPERAAIAAEAPLQVEDRARALDIHERGEHRDDRGAQDEPNRGADEIDGLLEGDVERIVERQVGNAQHRHTAHRFEVQAGDESLEATRDDLELDHLLLAEV